MPRVEMTEIHDHPRFPATLRNLVTEALEAIWEFGNTYHAILPVLHELLTASHELLTDSEEKPAAVIDLCSGGGGPWLSLAKQLRDEFALTVRVCLTDRYPNPGAFQQIQEKAAKAGLQIGSCPRPVDAGRVPPELRGLRTMFSSFHHFGPDQARSVLRSAVEGGHGIAVFEAASRSFRTLLAVCCTPLLVLWITPRIRPFSLPRLLWTYLLPIVPFVIWYDGIVSCMRTYSLRELRELVSGMGAYRWRIGEARTGFLPVTYLTGVPGVSPKKLS